MVESNRIFSATRVAMMQKLSAIDEKLSQNTAEMQGLDRDGDLFDDPVLHILLEDKITLEADRKKIESYLNTSLIVSKPESSETVSLGHSVTVHITYSDGPTEKIEYTIGSALDKQFLNEAYPKQNDESVMIVPIDSPVAKALLGRRIGDQFKYDSPGGTNKVVVLDIKNSSLLSEGGAI